MPCTYWHYWQVHIVQVGVCARWMYGTCTSKRLAYWAQEVLAACEDKILVSDYAYSGVIAQCIACLFLIGPLWKMTCTALSEQGFINFWSVDPQPVIFSWISWLIHIKIQMDRFCFNWSSKPSEFLCVTQKGDNLDQQKNSEDQLKQVSAGPVDQFLVNS